MNKSRKNKCSCKKEKLERDMNERRKRYVQGKNEEKINKEMNRNMILEAVIKIQHTSEHQTLSRYQRRIQVVILKKYLPIKGKLLQNIDQKSLIVKKYLPIKRKLLQNILQTN